MTNGDQIRSMDDVELVDFLTEWAASHTEWHEDPGETLGWIQQPYDEEG